MLPSVKIRPYDSRRRLLAECFRKQPVLIDINFKRFKLHIINGENPSLLRYFKL
jgi:hypothetical protein